MAAALFSACGMSRAIRGKTLRPPVKSGNQVRLNLWYLVRADSSSDRR